jgi:hypothetical protein
LCAQYKQINNHNIVLFFAKLGYFTPKAKMLLYKGKIFFGLLHNGKISRTFAARIKEL